MESTDNENDARTREGYDRVAEQYTKRYLDELRGKPLDRALLYSFVEQAPAGPVADLGCGPGHVTYALAGLGRPVIGVDLSAGMIEQARAHHPDLPFAVGSMTAIDTQDNSWAGIVSFYSVVHLTPRQLPRAFAEFARVLVPGGLVLLAFHVGDEIRHVDRFFEMPVSLDFRFLRTTDVANTLKACGFSVEMIMERAAYATETPTIRGYVLARAS
jgi:ubiquinone/menaquinone biosynthesis C-methylase UbiE